MTQNISVAGLSSSNLTPGIFIDLQFAQGDLSGDNSTKKILILAPKLSGAAAVDNSIVGPDTAISITSLNDVKTLFGVGSEAAVMYEMVSKANGGVNPIYIGCVPAATGNAAAKTITFTGTATSASSVRVFVGEKYVDVAIDVGDTPTVLSGKVIVAVNALQTLVTASGTTTVVLTYNHIGLRGNYFRVFTRIASSCGVTSDTTTSTLLTGGTGVSTITTLITEMTADKFFYICTSDGYTESANITLLKAHLLDQASPVKDSRSRLFVGFSGDYSSDLTNRATWIAALNCERIEILSQHKSDFLPGLLAAQLCAIAAQFESQIIPRCNFNGFGSFASEGAYWFIRPTFSNSKPTAAQISNDINLGVSCVKTQGASTNIVKRCTTRYLLTASGSITDFRIREPHKVTVSDLYVLDLQAVLSALMQGKMIASDPVPGGIPTQNSVYPKLVRSKIIRLLQQYKENNLLEDIESSIKTLIIQRSPTAQSRFEIKLNLDISDILDQIVGVVGQVG